MAILSPNWDAYARLQHQLATTFNEGERSAGIEAALDRFLLNTTELRSTVDTDLERASSTGRRGVRRRNRLIERYLDAQDGYDPSPCLEANDILVRLRQAVSNDEWELLTSIADGESYSDLAEKRRSTAQNLRVSVCRSRRRLSHLLVA